MKKTLQMIAILFFINLKMNSQIIPVSLEYKIENAPFIIEGQILEANSKQDKLNTI